MTKLIFVLIAFCGACVTEEAPSVLTEQCGERPLLPAQSVAFGTRNGVAVATMSRASYLENDAWREAMQLWSDCVVEVSK